MEAVARGIVASRGLSLVPDPELGVRVILSGEDVSDAIRAAEMGMGASRVSAIGGVRDALFQLQRLAGEDGGVVLEGRDIGTVVFPDAEVKFFLTASAEVRARRRHAELVARGEEVGSKRPSRTCNRATATTRCVQWLPLRQADDAILIDSTARSRNRRSGARYGAKCRDASTVKFKVVGPRFVAALLLTSCQLLSCRTASTGEGRRQGRAPRRERSLAQ